MIQDVDHEPNPAEVCSVRLLALDKSGRNKWVINHLPNPKIVAMMQVYYYYYYYYWYSRKRLKRLKRPSLSLNPPILPT